MKGHLTRRGERSWRLKYDLPRARPGERQQRSVTLRGTRKEAQAEAAKILASVAGGTHVDPSGETVASFVERWLRDWADANISHKTFTRYEQLLRKHLCAHVGSIPLQKLRAADLQAIYAAMAKDGLADRTRLHLHRVVSTMLKHATQWGAVARNVASMVDAPRVKASELEILTPEQLRAALASLRSPELRIHRRRGLGQRATPWRTPRLALAGRGLRRGNAAGGAGGRADQARRDHPQGSQDATRKARGVTGTRHRRRAA